MKPILSAFMLAATLAAHSGAHAQSSMLRVACGGEAIGAEVSVNGKFKGTCPVDMLVEPGMLKLRAVKKIDALRERVFEQEVRMGEGVAKKVEVRLDAPGFSAEGQRQEAVRLKAYAEQAPVRDEDAQWKRAIGTATRASMQAYLDKYPNRRYVSQARQKDDEYLRVPPRPQIPLAVSEDIWKIIEASEAYRNTPRQRTTRVSYNSSSQTVKTGAKNASDPPSSYRFSQITEKVALGDRCTLMKQNGTSDGKSNPEVLYYNCGFIRLGYTRDGKTNLIKTLDELTGSLFPMRIGARSSMRTQTTNLWDSKYVYTSASSCEVVSQRPARELDSRLAGAAWKVHCQTSFSSSSDNRTKASEYDDDYLEDLGIRLSDIGAFDAIDETTSKVVLPTQGSQTTYMSGGEYASRTTTTFQSYDWTVGE